MRSSLRRSDQATGKAASYARYLADRKAASRGETLLRDDDPDDDYSPEDGEASDDSDDSDVLPTTKPVASRKRPITAVQAAAPNPVAKHAAPRDPRQRRSVNVAPAAPSLEMEAAKKLLQLQTKPSVKSILKKERRQIQVIDVPTAPVAKPPPPVVHKRPNRNKMDRVGAIIAPRSATFGVESKYATSTLAQFYEEILDWDFGDAVIKDNSKMPAPAADTPTDNIQVPSKFESYQHYFSVWKPLAVQEVQAQALNGLASDMPPALPIVCTPSSSLGAMTVKIAVSWNKAHTDTSHKRGRASMSALADIRKDDLVVISTDASYLSSRVHGKEPSAAVGVLAIAESQQSSREGLVVVAHGTRWRQLQWVAQMPLFVFKVNSLVTSLREFRALCECRDYKLMKLLLSGDSAPSTMRLDTLGLGYVQWLRNTFNESQQEAITAAATSQGFTLIKGPPGTGKTTTLKGLLNSLHLREYNRYYNAVLDVARRPDKDTHAAWARIGSEKPHILVAAPSNIAVDNIVGKIIDEGFCDGEGRRYFPQIVRVGRGVTASVKSVSLDGMVDAISSQPLEVVDMRVQQLTHELRVVENDAAVLRHELRNVIAWIHGVATASLRAAEAPPPPESPPPPPPGTPPPPSPTDDHPPACFSPPPPPDVLPSEDGPPPTADIPASSTPTTEATPPPITDATPPPITDAPPPVMDVPPLKADSPPPITDGPPPLADAPPPIRDQRMSFGAEDTGAQSSAFVVYDSEEEAVPFSVDDSSPAYALSEDEEDEPLPIAAAAASPPDDDEVDEPLPVPPPTPPPPPVGPPPPEGPPAAKADAPLVIDYNGYKPYKDIAQRINLCLERANTLRLEWQRYSMVRQALQNNKHVPKETKDQLESSFLESAHIVFTTLSSAGHRALDDSNRYDILVIDEAAQAVELSTIIPMRFGSKQCVLVGDPQQLSATVFSRTSAQSLYERSLFERLESCGHPVHMLRTQYRSHPVISAFPRQYFYGGLLMDGENVSAPGYTKPYHSLAPAFLPLVFWNLLGSREKAGPASRANQMEIDLAVNLYLTLRNACPPDAVRGKVGVITPYAFQMEELKRAFKRACNGDYSHDVEINTVDGYQGREKDIIILSTVRADPRKGVGFLSDIRRMNVALTRAKYACYVIGSEATLVSSKPWRALLDHARATHCMVHVADPQENLLQLRPGAEPPRTGGHGGHGGRGRGRVAMAKRLFLDKVTHLLQEVFEPVDEAGVDVSVLGDLFDDSHLRLEHLFLKRDVFNALPVPFALLTGYIGQLHVQGMLGALTGAPVTLVLRDVHVVLSAKSPDWDDADALRLGNELLVALMHRLWNRYHMEGTGPKKVESLKSWLKMRAFGTLRHMTVKIENVHVRVQLPSPTLETPVVGVVIPLVSVTTCDGGVQVLHRREVPAALQPAVVVSKLVVVDRLQVYTTTNATATDALSSAQWREQFTYVWPAEARDAMLLPVGVQLKVDWTTLPDGKQRLSGVDVAVSRVFATLAPTQVRLLADLLAHVDAFRRRVRYAKLKPYGSAPRPPLLALPPFVLLPPLRLPPSAPTRRPPLSARARWRFALRCILADLHPRRDVLWLSPVILAYTDLYKRQASAKYIAHVTRDLAADKPGAALPQYAPLSSTEADTLSDFVYQVALDHQLLCRAVCDRVIRQDFARLHDAPHAPLLKRRSLQRLGTAQDLTAARGWKSLSNVEDFLFGQAALGLHVPRAASQELVDEAAHPVPAFFKVPRPTLHVAIGPLRVGVQDDAGHDVWVASCGSLTVASIVAVDYVLVELRLGKLTVAVSPARLVPPSTVVSVAYIHEEADGCVYVGLRYDPLSVAAKHAWKVKAMVGKVKACVSAADADRWQASVAQPHGSLLALVRGEYKGAFKVPAKPRPTKSRVKEHVKQGLEALLQATTLVEVAVGGLDAELSARTLAWLEHLPLDPDTTMERAHVFVPPHALSLSNDMDANECTVDVLHHRVTFSGSAAGHRAAIAYLLRHIF
ncbi:hypothetical protein ACHHYP_02059 [Achlya hypogyna]|uniref:Helicase ATP-binding domain-containing protein n=1 Tax=Achlya hypogyna TaxID=1202772 RepID=A0A1V9ZSH0_ACHHY|nr:hypothetical protein ACHHYP_02059 [Achlya hypogyna]